MHTANTLHTVFGVNAAQKETLNASGVYIVHVSIIIIKAVNTIYADACAEGSLAVRNSDVGAVAVVIAWFSLYSLAHAGAGCRSRVISISYSDPRAQPHARACVSECDRDRAILYARICTQTQRIHAHTHTRGRH